MTSAVLMLAAVIAVAGAMVEQARRRASRTSAVRVRTESTHERTDVPDDRC